jgi:hypothetical protein
VTWEKGKPAAPATLWLYQWLSLAPFHKDLSANFRHKQSRIWPTRCCEPGMSQNGTPRTKGLSRLRRLTADVHRAAGTLITDPFRTLDIHANPLEQDTRAGGKLRPCANVLRAKTGSSDLRSVTRRFLSYLRCRALKRQSWAVRREVGVPKPDWWRWRRRARA